MPVDHDRFELHRKYGAPVDQVFANWADPALKRVWFAEPGNEYALDFRVGGEESNRGRAPNCTPIAYLARYSDIVTGERIVYTYDLSTDRGLISVSLVSVTFAATPAGGCQLWLVEQMVLLDEGDRADYRQRGVGTQLDRLGSILS